MNATATKSAKSANGPQSLVTQETPLVWSEIHWFDSENTRVRTSWGDPLSDFVEATRPLKDEESEDDRRMTPDGLVLRLLDGWQTNKQSYIEVTTPTADEIKRAHAERRAKLDAWAKDEGPQAELYNKLAAFVEPIWFPNGKPAEIKAIGNMAYRRGRAMPGVAYARKLRGKLGEFRVPCLFMDYTSPKQKFLAHIGENFGKDAGRRKYSGLDEAMLAVRFAELSDSKEADLVREGMKRGAAQKAWRFAQLNRKFRSAKLAERIMMDSEGQTDDGHFVYKPGGFVPYKSLDKEAMKRILDNRNPFDKQDGRKVLATLKSLEDYIQRTMAGGISERMLSRKELSHFEGDKVDVIRFLAQAVKEGSKAAIEDLSSKYGDKINDALAKVVKWEELAKQYFAEKEDEDEDDNGDKE